MTTFTDQPSLVSDLARYRPTNPEPPNRTAFLVLVKVILQLDYFYTNSVWERNDLNTTEPIEKSSLIDHVILQIQEDQ